MKIKETAKITKRWKRWRWFLWRQEIEVEAEQIGFYQSQGINKCKMMSIVIRIDGQVVHSVNIGWPGAEGRHGLALQVYDYMKSSQKYRDILEEFCRRCDELFLLEQEEKI